MSTPLNETDALLPGAAASSESKNAPPPSPGRAGALEEVRDAFKDHLAEALEGDDFFLTMALTRNMSLLPSRPELNQAVEEFQGDMAALRQSFTSGINRKREPKETEDPEAAPPLSAYLQLLAAVVALSSIGPFLAKQDDVDATLKIVWRFQGTAILLAPLTIHSLVVDRFPSLTWAQWGTFLCASASYSVLCVAFAMSVDYTTVSNATILTNSQSVLLVAAKLLIGQQVIFLEAMGVSIAFLGGVLAALEAAGDEAAPAQGWWSVWGDVLGLISSIGGIGYIILGKSLRAHFPVLLFMVLNMLTSSFIIILWMYLFGKELSWDRDYNHGVFGWMNLEFDRLPLEIMTVGICNFLGTLGYVKAFKYFSSVVIAVASLLEPVVAAFTATAMGVGVLPGVEGWIGNFLVIVGTLAVLYPTTPQYQAEQKRKESIDAEQLTTPRTPFPRKRTPRMTRPTTGSRMEFEDDEEGKSLLKTKKLLLAYANGKCTASSSFNA